MASSDSLKVASSVTERGVGDIVAARYRLIRKVGSGGMGSVWYAQDLSLDAPCAVKLIDGEKANDEGIRMRFEREAKASAQLRSAHVVNVFDYGEWNRTQYLAMEYLDGEDLAVRLTRLERLDFETTYRVIAHVARALMAAHAIGIVHRDLKPENIFLVQSYEEEIAKVLDFGIAQNNAYSIQDRATREGAFLGTPCYVSPEQARGRNIDHRSDLWSLGVIAFQCLTGRLPFEGKALGELMGQILYEPLPTPSSVNSSLPKKFDDWWHKAASRNREERFQSAKEMADKLGSVLGVHSAVLVPTVPPRRRTSIPPAEYSGVITAARFPEAAIRTTAPAPEDDPQAYGFRSQLRAELPLTRDDDSVLNHEARGEIDEYLAQLAAEPLVPIAKGAASTAPPPSATTGAAPRVVIPPAPSARVGAPSEAQPGAAGFAEGMLLALPRPKQASEVRFIDRELIAPASPAGTLAHVVPWHHSSYRRLARDWLSRASELIRVRRHLTLGVSIAGALAILCGALWLTLRTRAESVSPPATRVQASIEQSAASEGTQPEPRPISSAAPLTVDMLPLISGKARGPKTGDTSSRAPQSSGSDPKAGPKAPRKVHPVNDYGI